MAAGKGLKDEWSVTAAVVFMFAVLVSLAVRDVLREFRSVRLEGEWRKERSELIARLQHPEVFIPPAALAQARTEPTVPPEDDFERVGGVFYDEDEDA